MKNIQVGDHVSCTIRGRDEKLIGKVYAVFDDGYVGIQDIWRNPYTIHPRYITVTTPASYFNDIRRKDAELTKMLSKGCYATHQ